MIGGGTTALAIRYGQSAHTFKVTGRQELCTGGACFSHTVLCCFTLLIESVITI